MSRFMFTLLVSGLITLASFTNAFGIIIVEKMSPVDRSISLTKQQVDVTIIDGVSRTTIEQVFHNNHHVDLEGTYLFPIPDDASVSNFSMFIGGEEIKGEILDRDRAAALYQDIVRRMKDPGLLEYVGKGLFQARVYPIPARGDVKIKIQYEQVLPYDIGVVTYKLSPENPNFYRTPIRDFGIDISIESSTDIQAVYSPTHDVNIDRGPRSADITLTESEVSRTKDFVLYYTVSHEDIGLSVLSHYDTRAHEGYFLALIAPNLADAQKEVASKNILLVIDVSGSMSGEKIEQAKDALRFCLNSLNGHDRFSLVSFSDGTDRLSDAMRIASRANIAEALSYVDRLRASGGTDINSALLEALAVSGEAARADYIVFITDGEPTVGETNRSRIADNIRRANAAGWKIFCFGVGYEVDVELLGRLAQESHATAAFVRPGENIETTVSSFFAKIANPAMTGLRLSCADARLSKVYPRDLPDLFYGTQIVAAGKYDTPGSATIRLEGFVNGKPVTFSYPVRFGSRPSSDELVPRQWAIRRIGFLLDEVSKHNDDELKQEIVALSKKYGIVTPYTSFFVDEPAIAQTSPHSDHDPIAQISDVIERPAARGAFDVDGMNKPSSDVSIAAEKNVMMNRMETSDLMSGSVVTLAAPSTAGQKPSPSKNGSYAPLTELESKAAARVNEDKLSKLVTLGDRVFQKVSNTLIDSRYDGSQKVFKIKPYSGAYFELLRIAPELGKYLIDGSEVIVVAGDAAIHICDSGAELLDSDLVKLLN